MNIYETDRLLAEYLLFHYGEPAEILPYGFGPQDALGYPERCVSECLDVTRLPAESRALDLGCAVGRSSFELARHCQEVIGIDYSQRFIEAAATLRDSGELSYGRRDEGELGVQLVARPPSVANAVSIVFETGDAQALRPDLGAFDVVLMANLIDRLAEPQRCLARLPELVKPNGQLIITSPYTWLEEFTPQDRWLGGRQVDGRSRTTLEGLQQALSVSFELVTRKDLPFLIREHARKFQWRVAEATLWRRKPIH
jgi:putative 4-mercaptohistidine N1-methyltranferase